jgi:MFS family permease
MDHREHDPRAQSGPDAGGLPSAVQAFPVFDWLPSPIATRLRTTFRALRHRNFRLFWTGQLVSLVGTWMQSAAQGWLVHRLTHEPIWLGLAGTATFLPVFLFSFLGGVAADRLPKRRLIIATQCVALSLALILAVLTFTHTVTVYHILVIAFLLGTVNAFDMPARQSFVIEMVGGDDLINAVALNSSVFNAAKVVGPAVAGLLIATTGESVCFLLNGLSFIPVIIGLLAMRLPPHPRRDHRPVWHELREGFRFVIRTPRIRTLLEGVAITSIFGMSFSVLLPVFAEGVLGRGARTFGLLMGAVGLGAVVAALRLAGRTTTKGSGRLVAIGMTIFGAALFGFSYSRSFLLSELLLFFVGGAMITQLATTNTLLQRSAPDAIRGRVLSAYTFVLVGLAPIGTFLYGLVAQKIGGPWAVRIGGVICLAGAAWFSTRIPQLRSAANPSLQQTGEVSPPAAGPPSGA